MFSVESGNHSHCSDTESGDTESGDTKSGDTSMAVAAPYTDKTERLLVNMASSALNARQQLNK